MSDQFFTDEELRTRWKCSDMKLWRLREKGKLPAPIKIGGSGRNLTPVAAAIDLENERK